MRIHSLLATLVSAALVCGVLGGTSAAQATPGSQGSTCPTIAPGALRTQSIPTPCFDHGQLFDPTPNITDEQFASAIAISGDGNRALWARVVAEPSSECGDPAVGQRLALYPGVVTAKNTTWLQPFYVSLGCRFADLGMSLVLNTKGTDAGLMFSDHRDATAKSIYYAVFSWPLAGSLNQVALRTLATSGPDDTPTGVKASMSRTGKTIFFSGGFHRPAASDSSNFAVYNYQTGDRTEWSLPELVFDSGIAANGITTFAVTRADAGTTPASSDLKTYVCRVISASCTFDVYKISNQGADTEALAAMNDAGTQIAISWTRRIGRFWRHFATSFPLPAMQGQTIEAPVNIRAITNDDTRSDFPLGVFINPAGTQMWVGGLDRSGAKTYALSASINKYVLTWSEPNLNSINLPNAFRTVAFAVSRNGRIATSLTSDDLQLGVISVADGNTGPAMWAHSFISITPSTTPYLFQIAMSDDGSRYVTGFVAWNAYTRAIATSGLFLPFQFVKKAPVVSGVRKVGSKLTVAGDTWRVTGGRNTYQWMRDGQFIQNATSATYKLTNDDAGHAITVSVRHTKAGYYDRLLTAGSTAIVTGGRMIAATPVIQGYYVGHPHANQTELSVDLSAWGPGTPTFAFVWKVNGAIKGRAATYTPAEADIDKTITVTVTATLAGFTTVSKTSAASPVVFQQVGIG
jgi:hypothetical protein